MAKQRITTTIDLDLYLIAKTKQVCLSQIFNDFLRDYLNAQTGKTTYVLEDLETDLEELHQEISRLSSEASTKQKLIRETKQEILVQNRERVDKSKALARAYMKTEEWSG